ncbi:GntR family transcriptional regulator [Salinicoccus kekensis]|uniref:GntR family transcriptional regulator n=1 Tax=Salinicoccus kekensis TaxID=714307 RepID=A0A285U6I0_9STAP|nr:GntR family transcriptional regulator [Salinicoccus kekensis]SOC37550.1 GntR family transcriptional regulator [Salinicoccus kekensis]
MVKSKVLDNPLPIQIAELLLYRIFSGELVQGQRLKESEIAQELQVSHAPVREAFYILQKDNILERLPRRGVTVRTISDEELNDYIEILVVLLRKAVKDCEDKWNADVHDEFERRVKILQIYHDKMQILNYITSAEDLLRLFFEASKNTASVRFYSQIAMITKVAAQTKWTPNKINQYHQSLRKFIKSIEELNFELAIEEITETTFSSFLPS